ncbi:HNH endonuclease signature motif containing protein [Lacunimicrobium album]
MSPSTTNKSTLEDLRLIPQDAATYLGITMELLFQYCRYPAKRSNSETRILHFDGATSTFSKSDLDEWDRYLQVPWADASDSRPKIPTFVEDYLKVECAGKCAMCNAGHKLENAHITPWSETRSHHHHNLIRVCSDCHDKVDDGIIARSVLHDVKQRHILRVQSLLTTDPLVFSRQRIFAVPHPDPHFHGRDDELDRLRPLLRTERLVFIHGVAGIGKTQLLVNALPPKTSQTLYGLMSTSHSLNLDSFV